MSRRRSSALVVRVATTLALACVSSLAACEDEVEAAALDGTFVALPSVDEVSDDLRALVPGERQAVSYEPGDAIRGAAEPLVTIVAWSDFQCPFCGQFANTLDELLRVYPDDVRVVFKQFPLPMHPQAADGARATLAAQVQGRFWAMHDRLFEHRHKLQKDDLREHAKTLGLDEDRFMSDLESPQVHARLDAEIEQGRALGVRGTPTFFVNGRRFGGMLEPSSLRELIEAERKIARDLMAAGSKRNELYAHFMRAARSSAPSAALHRDVAQSEPATSNHGAPTVPARGQ